MDYSRSMWLVTPARPQSGEFPWLRSRQILKEPSQTFDGCQISLPRHHPHMPFLFMLPRTMTDPARIWLWVQGGGGTATGPTIIVSQSSKRFSFDVARPYCMLAASSGTATVLPCAVEGA